MGVDDAEGRRLGAQMEQDAHQHRVLEHVGEAAGVEGVAIVHARDLITRAVGAEVETIRSPHGAKRNAGRSGGRRESRISLRSIRATRRGNCAG